MSAPAENLPVFLTLREVGRLVGRAPQHVAKVVRRNGGFDGRTSAAGLLVRLDRMPTLRTLAAWSMKPKPGRASRAIL